MFQQFTNHDQDEEEKHFPIITTFYLPLPLLVSVDYLVV